MSRLPPTVVFFRAAFLVVLALCSGIPVVVHLTRVVLTAGSACVDPWIYLVLLLILLQIAYAIYAVQIRDVRVLRVLVILLTTLSALYSMLCGLTATLAWKTMVGQGLFHMIVVRLQLTDEVFNGRVPLWCGAMAGGYGLLAYFFHSDRA